MTTAERMRLSHEARWGSVTRDERFWSKVSFPAGGAGCWLWTGAKNEHGYGHINTSYGMKKAHRWSLELHLGRPTEGNVLHSCDTPACVRPDHLREGSQLDNVRDAIKRGRHKNPPKRAGIRGEIHPSAKLTAEQVAEIKKAPLGRNGTKKALAEKFGVSHSIVSMILHGKRWAHV